MPTAVTENVAVWPMSTDVLVGCPVMVAGMLELLEYTTVTLALVA